MRRTGLMSTLAAAGLLACFTGEALQGEPCSADADCGPSLRCVEGGLCGEFRCPATPLVLPTFAPDVTLIVTSTASMGKSLADDPDTTRWQEVLTLVDQIGAALGDRVNLGLQVVPTLSPQTNLNPCDTDARSRILPGPDQGPQLNEALPKSPPGLGEHALRAGLDLSLAGFALTDPDDLRPHAIVLISDRPLNCSDAAVTSQETVELFDNELTPRVAELAAGGVPVFVVGIDIQPGDGVAPFPGADYEEVDPQLAFNALADAGGRPRSGATRFYRPEDAAALIADLAAIPPAFADCRVHLDAAPAYPQRLVLRVDEHNHRAQPDCSSGHGWRYPDPEDPTTLELCPVTCADFRAARALTIEQRCPSE